jgi:hypothetical protein
LAVLGERPHGIGKPAEIITLQNWELNVDVADAKMKARIAELAARRWGGHAGGTRVLSEAVEN